MTMGHLYADSNEIKNVLRYSSNQESHGTHVLGIAAGTPVKAQKATYSGIAKDADIVAVELGTNQEEPTVLEATAYMFRYADSVNKPISINYSLGFPFIYHACDGESLDNIAMSELLQENPKGKIVTAGAGNKGNEKSHCKINLGDNDSFFVNIPFSDIMYYGPMPIRLLLFTIWGEDNKHFAVDLYYKNGSQQIKYASYNTNNYETFSGELVAGDKVYNAGCVISAPQYPNDKPSIIMQIADVQTGQLPDSCYIVVKGSNTTINM